MPRPSERLSVNKENFFILFIVFNIGVTVLAIIVLVIVVTLILSQDQETDAYRKSVEYFLNLPDQNTNFSISFRDNPVLVVDREDMPYYIQVETQEDTFSVKLQLVDGTSFDLTNFIDQDEELSEIFSQPNTRISPHQISFDLTSQVMSLTWPRNGVLENPTFVNWTVNFETGQFSKMELPPREIDEHPLTKVFGENVYILNSRSEGSTLIYQIDSYREGRSVDSKTVRVETPENISRVFQFGQDQPNTFLVLLLDTDGSLLIKQVNIQTGQVNEVFNRQNWNELGLEGYFLSSMHQTSEQLEGNLMWFMVKNPQGFTEYLILRRKDANSPWEKTIFQDWEREYNRPNTYGRIMVFESRFGDNTIIIDIDGNFHYLPPGLK